MSELIWQPRKWDLLVGHYLGVDHAGHTYGVASPQMHHKVRQMDDEITQVRVTAFLAYPALKAVTECQPMLRIGHPHKYLL